MKLNGRVTSAWIVMNQSCYESALLDGWMKENACKIIGSDIEPW